MLKRIYYIVRNFIMIPYHLNEFLKQLNDFEDRYKFNIGTRLDSMDNNLNTLKVLSERLIASQSEIIEDIKELKRIK